MWMAVWHFAGFEVWAPSTGFLAQRPRGFDFFASVWVFCFFAEAGFRGKLPVTKLDETTKDRAFLDVIFFFENS